jgi:hypothetical protein
VALARGAFDREGQGQDRGGRRRSLLHAGRSDRSNGVRPAGTALPAPARALRHAQALYLVYAAGHAAITLLRRRATWVRCAQGRIRFCRRATSGGPLPDHGLTGPRSGADHGAGPVAQAPWRRPRGAGPVAQAPWPAPWSETPGRGHAPCDGSLRCCPARRWRCLCQISCSAPDARAAAPVRTCAAPPVRAADRRGAAARWGFRPPPMTSRGGSAPRSARSQGSER